MYGYTPLRRFFGFLLAAMWLAGCQAIDADSLVASSAPPEISGQAASAIAGDMVSRLAEHVGPGTGTIVLKPDGSPFGDALEDALKTWGYAVVSDQKAGGEKLIPLAYLIDSHEGRVLARLSTASIDLGRAYATTATGAAPASPLSVMRRG
ncbi:MAG: conjugal transfer protein TrbH [Pseudaminobacter sp.]|nr:conjugal transfer protein TrbH [Pseudaminobacter sp.]